jgi:predicted transcriptional regulator
MPSMAKPARGKVVLYLEVPKALKEQLERLAKEDLRSLTAECVVALREFVARRTAQKEGGQ